MVMDQVSHHLVKEGTNKQNRIWELTLGFIDRYKKVNTEVYM